VEIFVCCICKEKSDDSEEFTHPTSKLANSYAAKDEWMCKECSLDIRDEKWIDFDNEVPSFYPGF